MDEGSHQIACRKSVLRFSTLKSFAIFIGVWCLFFFQEASSQKGWNPEIVKPFKECSHGYSRSGKICTKEHYKRPTRTCPHKGDLNDNLCMYEKKVVAERSCPPGTTLKNDHKCEVVDAKEPLVTCPKDYTLSGKTCYKTSETRANSECPTGYKKSEGGDACYVEKKTKPSWSCPKGTEPTHNGKCTKIEYALAQTLCPSGYGLQSAQPNAASCVKIEEKEATEDCPRGYTLKRDDGISITANYSQAKHIGDGHALVERSAFCSREIKHRPKEVCPSGYDYDGRSCVLKATVSAVPRCNKDFIYDSAHGRCVKVLEETPKYECPNDYKKIEYPTDASVGPICVSESHTKPETVCPQGTVEKGSHCISVDSIPAKRSCPHDYLYQDGRCVHTTYKHPETKCPKGFNLHGTHHSNDASGAQYHGASSQRCSREATVVANAVCGPSFRLHRDHCVAQEVVPLVPICSSGELTAKGSCVEVLTADTESKCPRGYTLEGDQRCVRRSHTHSGASCPTGAVLKGDSCIFVETSSATIQCDHGYSYKDGRCVKYSQKEPEWACPKDFKLVSNVCLPKNAPPPHHDGHHHGGSSSGHRYLRND